jgi:sulfonate transport system permease protein
LNPVVLEDHRPEVTFRPSLAERDVRRFTRRSRRAQLALAIAVPTALIVIWQWAASGGHINEQFFPAPTSVWRAGVDMVRSRDLLHDIIATTKRILPGFLLGSAAGILVGFVTGLWTYARAALNPLLWALYVVPKIALLPLLLLIFGLGETPRILLIAMTVFFFVWISTENGIRSIESGYIDAAVVFGARRREVIRHVIVPATLPAIFVGLRIAAGVSVLSVVAVEYIAANDGVGHTIWYSWSLFLADRMYVGIIVIALMGLAFTALITVLQRWFTPWCRTNRLGATTVLRT